MIRPLQLFLVGVALHAALAALLPGVGDWDQAYYLSVAHNLAAGRGATSGALWTLLLLPDALPMPADLYWMPLPSRVLVPGVLLWPAHGEALIAIPLAAAWGPAAWWLARKLDLSDRTCVAAGLLALLGGPFAGRLATADTYAIFGLIGALGLGALCGARPSPSATEDNSVGQATGAQTHLAWLLLSAALAALCRNDGFLWGAVLGLVLAREQPWRGASVALMGLTTTLAWQLRNLALIGPSYLNSRRATGWVVDYPDLITGVVEPLPMLHRLELLLTKLPRFVEFWGLSGMGLLTALALVGLWHHRRTPWVAAVALYWLALPFIDTLLAPGVAWHGTLYRSVAAIFPALCAIGVAGLGFTNRWAISYRGYHPRFLPMVVSMGFGALFVGGVIVTLTTTSSQRRPDCEALRNLDDPVIFSYSPTLTEVHCARASVVLVRGMPSERVQALAERYDIHHALLAPAQLANDEGSPTEADADALLPGWTQVEDRLYQRPHTRD